MAALISQTRWAGWLAFGFTLFIFYGSLVPFNLVLVPFDIALSTFVEILKGSPRIQSKVDFATNILLSIPLAFFLSVFALSIQNTTLRHLWLLSVLLLCVSLALTVEFLQIFAVSRTPSKLDIMAQGFGAILGVSFWLWRGQKIWLDLMGRSPQASPKDFWQSMLYVYLIGLLAYNVLPLDLTLSPTEVYHKWKAGRILIVPFQFSDKPVFERLYEIVTDIMTWVPVAFLLLTRWRYTRTRVVVTTVTCAFVLELLQLLVYSRVTDSTDVIFALLGALLGVAVAGVIKRDDADTPATQAPSPAAIRRPQNNRFLWGMMLFQFVALVIVLSQLKNIDGVPYNVKELLGGSVLDTIVFSMALLWAVLPLVVAVKFILQGNLKLLFFTGIVCLHPFVLYGLLKHCVPTESLHDIVGSPVLSWPWEWEPLLRFVVLYGIIIWSSIGAQLLLYHTQKRISVLLCWLLMGCLVGALWHWVVVSAAGADNLTELFRGEGTWASTSWLFGWCGLTFFTAFLLAKIVQRQSSHPLLGIILVMGAVPGSYFILQQGLEPVIIKYGQVFSGMQFLLSPDRSHYVREDALFYRYLLAYLVMLGLIIGNAIAGLGVPRRLSRSLARPA